MPFVKGAVAQFTVQDAGGTVRDLSTFIKDIDFPRKSDQADTTTFGATAHTKLNLLLDGSIKISGPWDPTASTGPDAVLSGILGGVGRNFVYGPAGSTTGNIRYTGSAICTDYNVKQSVTGLVEWSATLEISGPVTRDTF